MKLNHRLLITSGLLLAMSTVAMSTATYAWFTTTRQSQISLNNVTIQQDSNLEMKVVSYNGVTQSGDMSQWKVHENLSLEGKAVQDVSGDGTSFFKPNIASDGKSFTSVKDVSAANSPTEAMYTYVHEIKLGFRSDKPYEVWLGKGTGLTELTNTQPGTANTTTFGLSDCARVAFFDLNSGGSGAFVSDKAKSKTLTGVYVNVAESAGYNFLTGTTAKSIEVKTESAFNTGYSDFTTFSGVTPIAGAIEDKTTDLQNVNSIKVCTLAKHEINVEGNKKYETMTDANNQTVDAYLGYVGIRIWVEGTDANCVDNARYGKFNTALKFLSFMPSTPAA